MKYHTTQATILIVCSFAAVVNLEKISNTAPKKENNEIEDEELEVFTPSTEWRKVRKGQPIPQGLHVRMNLQTGETEAKLLSESESKKTSLLSVTEAQGVQNTNEDIISTDSKLEEIKKSLFNLEDNDVGPISEENLKQVNEKFRSYEELKEKFSELKMAVKTDMELINDLLLRFKAKQSTAKMYNSNEDISDEEKLTILTDMEYLVHQFDNAREFVRLGGLTDIVLPILNGSQSALRSQAAHLLGSAVQSNPQVQIAALDSGSMGSLLRALALDTDPIVRSRALYALSCLVRNFPAAQTKLVQEGGLSVLGQLFRKEGQEELKLQVKTVTLIHDLMIERRDALQMLSDGSSANKSELQEKVRQYEAVGLEFKLVEQGWCSHLPQLLLSQELNRGRTDRRDDLSSAVTRNLPVRPEHDVVEKVAGAMLAVADLCRDNFTNNQALKDKLLGFKGWYSELATREDLDRQSRESDSDLEHHKQYHYYYSGMAQLLNNLTEALKFKSKKDEL